MESLAGTIGSKTCPAVKNLYPYKIGFVEQDLLFYRLSKGEILIYAVKNHQKNPFN